MKLMIFTIRDQVADQCGPLITVPNEKTAIRAAKQALSKTDDPRDFRLYQVGTFEDYTGSIESLDQPREISLHTLEEEKTT